MDLPALRAAMESDGIAWSELLAQDLDPDSVIREVDETRLVPEGGSSASGWRTRCTTEPIIGARSAPPSRPSGVEPPTIDVWDFGVHNGRVVEVPPTS
jgi:hypothetical protein